MRLLHLFISMSLVLVITGCTREKRATDPDAAREIAERSGFLGDYSDLTPSNSAYEPLLTWRDPNVPEGTYKKVIIESVQIWGDIKKDKDRQEDLVALANYMRNSFATAIGKVVPVVDEPGPDTAIIRLAITDAAAQNSTMKAISTIVPIGIAASAIVEADTDRPAFAADITIEFMMLDSITGKVYAKGVDRRVGGRSLATITDSWATARAAIDAWSNVAAYRVCVLSGQKEAECPLPKI